MTDRGVAISEWLRIAALSLVVICSGCSDIKGEIDDLPPLPESISNLPIGIIVEPAESIVEPQLEEADIKSLSSTPNPVYRWDHPITINGLDEDVQILEYGVFVWIDGQWYDATEEQHPYPAEEFAEAFQCEDALLITGKSYQSERFSNWRNVPQDEPVIVRWYFIGETEEGRCRGEVTLVDLPI